MNVIDDWYSLPRQIRAASAMLPIVTFCRRDETLQRFGCDTCTDEAQDGVVTLEYVHVVCTRPIVPNHLSTPTDRAALSWPHSAFQSTLNSCIVSYRNNHPIPEMMSTTKLDLTLSAIQNLRFSLLAIFALECPWYAFVCTSPTKDMPERSAFSTWEGYR